MHRWRPDRYVESSSAQELWAEELIRKIEIEGNERVLDIGCGDGRITAGIADLVPRGSVLGIDSSEEMVRFAKERFPPEIRKNLRFAEVTPATFVSMRSSTWWYPSRPSTGSSTTDPSSVASGEPSSPAAGSSSSSAAAAMPPRP